MRRLAVLLALLGPVACGAPRVASVSDIVLSGTDGASHDVQADARRSRATVVTFFSAHCPCQRAHDGRWGELYRRYAPAGIAFLAIDSEADSSLALDVREARSRELPFPILSDPAGVAADALGAEYATYSVLLDPSGRVLYRGGLDSDKNQIHADATAYLQNALDQWLAGSAPNPAEAKALGCSLRRK